MFLLLDLRFVFCSRDLDVLRAQRIIGFLSYYPQINEVAKSYHVKKSTCHTHRKSKENQDREGLTNV